MKIFFLALITTALLGLGWFLIGLMGAGPQTAIHIDKDALEQDRIEWVEQAKEDKKDETILDMMDYLDELENKGKLPKS